MMSPDEANWELVKAMELPEEVKYELWSKVCMTLIHGEYHLNTYGDMDNNIIHNCAWEINLPFNVGYDLRVWMTHVNDIAFRLYYNDLRLIDSSRYIDYTPYGAVIDTLTTYYNASFKYYLHVINYYHIADDVISKSIYGRL